MSICQSEYGNYEWVNSYMSTNCVQACAVDAWTFPDRAFFNYISGGQMPPQWSDLPP